MKKKKRYTMSAKRILRDSKQADWSKRMRVAELRDEGLTFREIGAKLGCTRANAFTLYKRSKRTIPDVIAD